MTTAGWCLRQLTSACCLQCLMDQLLGARDEAGAPMGEQALRDELLTLLVAGQETSAVLLTWCLAFLAHNPGVQRACAVEVATQLGGALPSADSIRCAWQEPCSCLRRVAQGMAGTAWLSSPPSWRTASPRC